MQSVPPFRLARTPSSESGSSTGAYKGLSADACCAPSEAQLRSANRRARLVDLDSHLHCSIIGTCLSTNELRKLVPKFTDLDKQHASDLEIHHAAVELAIDGGPGAKALQKALDTRYSGAVRRFEVAKSPEALLALWKEALKSGDIPPAYWALMTHPQAIMSVRQVAFGDLHMLSHLVGAANRADIRRLVALEEENAALKDKIERQQNKLHEQSRERDATIRELTEQLAELSAKAQRAPDVSEGSLEAEVQALREALVARDEKLAIHTSRREAAEQRAISEQNYARTLSARLDDTIATLNIVQAECSALERAVLAQGDDAGSRGADLDNLAGKRVVYVGGRPGSNAALRQLVESAGGDFVVHDGGIEDRKGMFAAALPRADIVVFPVDCIDHDSMNLLKRVCDRHQVDYHPVRTASVASFMELMARLGRTAARKDSRSDSRNDFQTASQPPASRFCLKHG
ncbi:peptidase [Caballeronia sordidicola]|uniref:Peptidase n=1 Tax=Caballeronia sordidicola TaxID=196367 RepID=A0A158FSI0_CABSO|nr:DUF2325 domain-containing protein [Caballeronia sordidicola]SAL22581.1 peptidase [Caballeronia sordidicola]